jgi:hypothetical protein
MVPTAVFRGQKLVYSNTPPGGSTGFSPTTPGPLTRSTSPSALGDDPLAGDELRRFRADVRDANVVLKQVLLLAGGAPLGEEFAADFDTDPARGAIARADALHGRIRGGVGGPAGAASRRIAHL